MKKAAEYPAAFSLYWLGKRLVRWLFIPIFLLWKDLKCMLWWWRWQCPLQRVGILVPRIVLGHALSPTQGVKDHPDEEEEGGKGQERAPA